MGNMTKSWLQQTIWIITSNVSFHPLWAETWVKISSRAQVKQVPLEINLSTSFIVTLSHSLSWFFTCVSHFLPQSSNAYPIISARNTVPHRLSYLTTYSSISMFIFLSYYLLQYPTVYPISLFILSHYLLEYLTVYPKSSPITCVYSFTHLH